MAEPHPVVDVLSRMDDIARATDLINQTWSAPLVLPNLARAIQQTGGYVAGVMLGGRLVGASVAFLGEHRGQRILHSHVTAVTDRDRGLGTLIKTHQRDWCRGRGIAAITWTFDPLVARNAYLNLGKLGAVCDAYLPDHYGAMEDLVNAGEETDRLHVWWPVDDDRRQPASAGGARLLLDVGEGEEPTVLEDVGDPAVGASSDGLLAVRIPRDIEALRRSDAPLARRWRSAVRDVMTCAYDAGYRATGMAIDGTYLLTPDPLDPRR